MVETVHGPYKNRQMDIIFENWNTNSRQEYGDSFNKTSVDRMCGFMSVHGMWEVDACTGSQRHKEWFLNYQGFIDVDIDICVLQFESKFLFETS